MKISAILTNKKVRNYITDDLTFFIISKLPLKSLKRFTCVRKSWSLLFENHHFTSLFRNNFIYRHHSYYDDTTLLLQTYVTEFCSFPGYRFENIVKHQLPNPFEEEHPYFCILDSGSVTGILCLYKFNGPLNGRLVLWNPVTDTFKVIPQSSLEFVPPYQQFRINLHGFGYDHVRDDYKLIRLVSYFPPSYSDCEDFGLSYDDVPWDDIPRRFFWEVYSLKSNDWRKLDINVNVSSVRGGSVSGQRMYLDGICHGWYYTEDLHGDKAALASFDLVNEVFFSTPIPLDIPLDEDDEDSFYSIEMYLIVLNGSVALISYTWGTTTFDISVLSEIGVRGSWTKLFVVGPLTGIVYPIGAGKNGEIFFTKKDGEIFLYDLSSGMIEEVGVYQESCTHVFLYKENFISI